MTERQEGKVNWNAIFKRAGRRATGGGLAGGLAIGVNIGSFMWLRTTINYQYRHGGSVSAAMRHLYAEGGVLRFYKGFVPALFQVPFVRFGDTAATVGAFELLNRIERTKNLSPFVKTTAATLTAATWRFAMMPIDTCKVHMQVEGSFGSLVTKVRNFGPRVLFHGGLLAFVTTYASRFPWFFTNNLLSQWIPVPKQKPLLKFARNAGIGFASSAVAECIANPFRVCKVYKQSSTVAISYPAVVRDIVAKHGISGVMFRGLKLRLITAVVFGVVFNVAWRGFFSKDKK